MSVVIVDLDNFKQINDSHGHHIGDQVLEATARQLQDSLRNGDVLVRYLYCLCPIPRLKRRCMWLNGSVNG